MPKQLQRLFLPRTGGPHAPQLPFGVPSDANFALVAQRVRDDFQALAKGPTVRVDDRWHLIFQFPLQSVQCESYFVIANLFRSLDETDHEQLVGPLDYRDVASSDCVDGYGKNLASQLLATLH